MREFRQNANYNDILNQGAEEGQTETESTNGGGGHGNRYSLPYGLCASEGINTDGMTPREAWDAWTSKTGRTKEDAEREHWGKEASKKNAKNSPASDKQAKSNNQPKPLQDTPASVNAEATNAPIQQQQASESRSYTSFRGNIDEGAAKRAKDMTSWDDYKDGRATTSYNSDVSIFEKEVQKLFDRYRDNDTLSDADWERARNIADQYAKNLAEFTNRYNSINESYPSWFISGAGGYNNARHDKKMARLDSLFSQNDRTLDPTDNVYLDRIKGILSNRSIAAGDDNAIGKLQRKYDTLKAEMENGKAMNAYFRKNKTLVGFPGISEEAAKAFDAKNASGDYFSSQPFMPYRLQNGNAELRRIQGRIDELKKAQSEAEAAKANPEAAKAATAAKYPKVEGVEVQENAEEMRVQLRFPGKPDDDTRTLLKSYGFRWSPTQGAWQRQLNGNGTHAARMVMQTLANKK